MKIMVCLSVNYSPQYGLTVVINDINPEFTLGDMERQRQEILNRLTQEGIIGQNKTVPVPPVLQRIAIVSAAGAAGYGDGEGTLKLVDGPVLVNNDRVLLESKTFRLNYTAQSSDAHKFLVVVEDNFGSTPWEQTFEFNSKDSGDDNGGKIPCIITPVNPGTITPIGL